MRRAVISAERIERNVARLPDAPGCWLWTGTRKNGYGRLNAVIDGQHQCLLAHRVVYESLVGPVPDGLTLDHRCRVRACVNPAHLEPVTMKENILRGESAGARNAVKTHCPKGHPYSPENTAVRRFPQRRKDHSIRYVMGRICRACAPSHRSPEARARRSARRAALRNQERAMARAHERTVAHAMPGGTRERVT